MLYSQPEETFNPNNEAHVIKFNNGAYRGEANMRVHFVGEATLYTLSEAKKKIKSCGWAGDAKPLKLRDALK